MDNNSSIFIILLKALFLERSSKQFMAIVILSFSFSIAVILGTISLMDGFEKQLQDKLKKYNGDISVLLKNNSVAFNNLEFVRSFEKNKVKYSFGMFVIESFLMTTEDKEEARGVLVKGVSQQDFKMMLSDKIVLKRNEIVVGKELLKEMGLVIGDQVTLAFNGSSNNAAFIPVIRNFVIKSIVDHGIYQKDLRFVYVNLNYLQKILGQDDRVNNFQLIMSNPKHRLNISLEKISQIAKQINKDLFSYNVLVRPYWKEFQGLFRAVRVEKFTISLILQLIVIISIFNILALFFYIKEKRSKELFMFRTLGLSKWRVVKMWLLVAVVIWAMACILSFFWTILFNLALTNLLFFQLPGEVYVLSDLSLSYSITEIIKVFGLAFVWIMLISIFGIRKITKNSIITDMRKEFT